MSKKKNCDVKILAVEDDPGDFGLIQAYLHQAGYSLEDEHGSINWATTLADAKKLAERNLPDLVLLDLSLPDSSSLGTLASMRNALPDIPIIVLSGNADVNVAIAALEQGAQDYLVKGHYEHDAIGKAVRHALIRSKLEEALRQNQEQMTISQQIGGTGSWVYTIQTNGIRASANSLSLFGFPPGNQDYPLDDFLACIPERERVSQVLAAAIRERLLYDDEFVIIPRDGSPSKTIRSIGTLESDAQGNPQRVLGFIQNITERKAAEKKLQKSEALIRAILDNVPYLIWLKNTEGQFIAVNQSFFKTTGLEKIQDVLGKTDFDLWPEELAKKYRADDAEVLATGRQKLTEEVSMDKGEVHWVETFKAPILDMEGNLLGTTGFAQDITVRKNAEGKIRHLAHYDPLTDLPNRTLLSDRLQQALIAAKRDKAHMALMFIDLDKFKPINDELGHHVGDLLLKEAAKRMQDCVRESDTVARIGGDEFVVLLPIIEAEQDAILVAEKIREALNQPFVLVGQSLSISSSTGIAVYPEHGSNENHLFKNADTAMYYAKEHGRNSVTLYRPDMQ